MMNNPFSDAVAIDTNVFEHIMNPQQNLNDHISELLAYLQDQHTCLIIDDGDRISGEYLNQLAALISRSDDVGNEISILRYWILYAPRIPVKVTLNDNMMIAIRSVIIEPSENVDRIFVYVAFKQGNVLISNDLTHIVVGPTREASQGERRHRMLRQTRRMRPRGAVILTSQEAHDKIST